MIPHRRRIVDRVTMIAGASAEALRVNAGDADAHVNRGVVVAKLRRVEEARSHFERALPINPRLDEEHNNLGLLSEFAGDPRAARAHFEQALRINPRSAAARENLWCLRPKPKADGQPTGDKPE